MDEQLGRTMQMDRERVSPERVFNAAARDELGASSTVLRGKAAARGTHAGIARVISDDDDVQGLQKGDVLVCRAISPAWFTLFARIGALVTDAGGILSNPAIVAREHGIPVVVATANCTSLIRDGQRVAVDGERGVVLIFS